jgi:hypothetical protein
MTLDKAIDVMEDNRDFFKMDGFDECAEACQLGIEALKYVKGERKSFHVKSLTWLQGETGEQEEGVPVNE